MPKTTSISSLTATRDPFWKELKFLKETKVYTIWNDSLHIIFIKPILIFLLEIREHLDNVDPVMVEHDENKYFHWFLLSQIKKIVKAFSCIEIWQLLLKLQK